MHRGHVGGYTIVKEKVVALNSGSDGNDVTVRIHLEAIFEIELMWLLVRGWHVWVKKIGEL